MMPCSSNRSYLMTQFFEKIHTWCPSGFPLLVRHWNQANRVKNVSIISRKKQNSPCMRVCTPFSIVFEPKDSAKGKMTLILRWVLQERKNFILTWLRAKISSDLPISANSHDTHFSLKQALTWSWSWIKSSLP